MDNFLTIVWQTQKHASTVNAEDMTLIIYRL